MNSRIITTKAGEQMRELRVSYRVKDREIRGLLEREGFDLRRGYSAHAGIEQLIFTQTLS